MIVALGGFAWQSALALIRRVGGVVPTPVPRFGHGALTTVTVPGRSGREVRELSLLGCFHPSQQNTFTGRLTPAMMDDIFATALRIGRAK